MKKILLIFAGIISLYSCDKNTENSLVQIKEDYSVSIDSALDIVSKMNLNTKSNTTSKNEYKTKIVKNYKEVKNDQKKSVFYIVNFEEGGFIILAADKRSQPILASSDSGNFYFDEINYPSGLKFWMEDATIQMTQIINSNLTPSEREIKLWKGIEMPISNTSKEDPINTCYEHTEIFTKGPLSNITWNQGVGFNTYIPECSNSIHGRVGCVPLALAEIMKINEYPNNYSWNLMPSNYGNTTTSLFIKDVFDKIGEVYPGEPIIDDCLNTKVNYSNNLATVLKNKFGYSSAIHTTYNYLNVKADIDSNKAVILCGIDSSNKGHDWICDGYKSTTYYFDNCYGAGYLDFYMKWGWGSGDYNGWYSFDNFNPSIYSLNSNRKMIYNIIP